MTLMCDSAPTTFDKLVNNAVEQQMPNSAILTVAIGVRYTQYRKDLLARLSYCLQDSLIPTQVKFLLVDDGSDKDYASELQAFCVRKKIDYLRIDSETKPFFMGRARNFAAMHAATDYIMFMDVDLICYDGFYQQLIDEISIQELAKDSTNFLAIGVVYLTEYGSLQYLQHDKRTCRSQFIQYLLQNDNRYIEKFSTGTSAQIFNREYFLARGGNREDFIGWGYEDIELSLRAALLNQKFPIPRRVSEDYRNFKDIIEYRGFKSLIRLYGDLTFAKGIVLFHMWHEVDYASDYMLSKAANRSKYELAINAFLKSRQEPEPLADLSQGRTLLFTTTHPAICNREVMSRWGEVFVEDEKDFSNVEVLARYLQANNINRVVLQNPYSNELRLAIYNYLRANNIDYYIVERGALPNSMFFDPNGFNADSSSYDEKYWNIPLSSEKQLATMRYINEERYNAEALEAQASRISRNQLRRVLRINPGKKVLFVPLQTSSDTVIKYFCGREVPTFEAFLHLVQEVANTLPADWCLVIKKHPLMKNSHDFQNVLIADDYNIKDLLELADCVLLINSGVGLISMLFDKPVLYTGEVFYAHPKLNTRVNNAYEILSCLKELMIPDMEIRTRFIAFLLHDFYSFGRFTTKVIDWSEQANMTITTAIDFYYIPNLGHTKYIKPKEASSYYRDFKSILFDRFRFDLVYHKHPNRSLAHLIRPQAASKAEKEEIRHKRFKKMWNNPYKFFRDSRFFFLRPLKYLFRATS